MNELKRIAVGDDFDLFIDRNLTDQTGCILEYANDQFVLIVYLNNMTKEEEYLLQKVPITVRQIKEAYFNLFIVKFGTTNQVFEIAFNPVLYTDNRMDNLLNTNMVLMLGVESTTNKIKTIRQFNMPKKMFTSIIEQYQNGKNIIDYNNKFTRWVDDLDNRYSVLKLWDLGTYVGKMGEFY